MRLKKSENIFVKSIDILKNGLYNGKKYGKRNKYEGRIFKFTREC